jgi:hypothetical protein
VGLPGETMESFAAGFDRLYRFRPGEVQVGILKRLPGAPISVHDHRMRYNPDPPYDVLETDSLSAAEVERLKRFAKYWELVVNRGRFPERVSRLLAGAPDEASVETAGPGRTTSPFHRFLKFSDFAWRRFGRTWGLAPEELAAALDDFPVKIEPSGSAWSFNHTGGPTESSGKMQQRRSTRHCCPGRADRPSGRVVTATCGPYPAPSCVPRGIRRTTLRARFPSVQFPGSGSR